MATRPPEPEVPPADPGEPELPPTPDPVVGRRAGRRWWEFWRPTRRYAANDN